jgi:signal transduction histidine kinase
VRLRDKEQQISRLRMEGEAQEREKRWERVFFAVVLGLSIVLVLLWVGRMRKQHRIGVMQGAIDAEERERHKIADQLHDEVGGLLSLATLNLSAALEKGTGGGAPEEKLQKTQDVLFLVSTTVRELSHRLTPLAIEKYGIVQAIQDLADAINMSGKLSVQLVIVGFGDTGRYGAAFLNELYRMLQELLHNVVKHAQAAHVLVEVVEHDQDISVVVDDDGIGFDKDSVVKGRGLETVRSKIAYFKGKVGIERKREGGTLIVIQLPIVQKV